MKMRPRADGATLAAYTAPRATDVNYKIIKQMRIAEISLRKIGIVTESADAST